MPGLHVSIKKCAKEPHQRSCDEAPLCVRSSAVPTLQSLLAADLLRKICHRGYFDQTLKSLVEILTEDALSEGTQQCCQHMPLQALPYTMQSEFYMATNWPCRVRSAPNKMQRSTTCEKKKFVPLEVMFGIASTS